MLKQITGTVKGVIYLQPSLVAGTLFGAVALFFCSLSLAGMVNKVEKALMPGELHKAHAKFESDCNHCHRFFEKTSQNVLCLDCHDHKNIAEDIKNKSGFHGRLREINTKECKVCHQEHKGRDGKIILLDKQTFDHSATDFVLRDSHKAVPCQNCHKPDKKYHQAANKCYDCHKKIEPHKGRLGKVCNSCHRSTTWFDFQFDHSRTKFELKDKHKGVECRDCHPRERYQSVPSACYSCHQSDDKHRGNFGQKCKSCHSEKGWSLVHFDHDKDTKFKLTGQHRNVECTQCHKKDPYKEDLKKAVCFSCHRSHDEHKGQFGQDCKKCHNTDGWRKEKFDHDKTKFPLKGEHKKIDCKDCHTGDLYKDKLKTDCYSCHKHNDPHEGQQGKRCDECHNEGGWSKKVFFDHGLAKFPLLGAHTALACEECHTSSNFKEAKAKCVHCHAQDDIHEKRLSEKCDYCHHSIDWKAWEFDHDNQTKYKLEGAHRDIDCLLCHREPMQKKVKLPHNCFGCHARDDRHDGGLGRNCERCHTPKSFKDLHIK